MQQPVVSTSDKKELDKLIRLLCLKSAQVIVQGRLGKSMSSKCNPTSSGGDKFNLAIKDYPEVQKEARCALTDGSPNFHSSFVIEISLQTSDSESLILEVWSLSVNQKFEDARIPHTVYRKMSMMLKSLICVSRATPAYKLSRNQGREYVNCFRIYTGKADISGLGESFKTFCIGSIGTPTGALTQSVAFRTSENLFVSTKKFVSEHPIDLSNDHFCSPGNFAMSSARPCNTLQSRLMGSKGYLSVSRSSSEQMESPTYFVQQSPGTPSPNNPYAAGSRSRAAMFTIGTPPAALSFGRTPPRTVSDSGRKMSDVSFDREPRGALYDKGQKPFLHSTSEQNFSYPLHLDHSRRRISHVGSMQDQRDTRRQELHDDIINDASMHSTLTNGENSFRPISCSPSNHSRSSSIDKVQSNPKSGTRSGNLRKSNLDSVTALKSSSPTNARVGFPDNIELNPKASLRPSEDDRRENYSKKSLEISKATKTITMPAMPTVGAFVRHSKKVKKVYDILNEGPSKQKFPFDDLLSKGEHNGIADNDCDTASKTGSVDCSSPSSSSSNSSTPSNGKGSGNPLSENFLMIELNPAFSRNDSARDLCAFYREIENAPDLVMFKDNNGEETQETLLDLTKQLEDYQRDAADFDDFIQELQAF